MYVMKLRIVFPGIAAIDAEVEKVSLPGVMGIFTVLEGHAPVIAQLKQGVVVYHTSEGKQVVKIGGGHVRILDSRVTVSALQPEENMVAGNAEEEMKA